MATRAYNRYEENGDTVTLFCHNKEQEYKVLIDAEDFDRVYHKYGRWRVCLNSSGVLCVKASTLGGFPKKISQLDRLVSGAKTRDKLSFLDGNPFNCRKNNILLES